MKTLPNSAKVPASFRHAIVACGNFDGVHRGHQALLREAVNLARDQGCPSLAYSFEPHPSRLFSPHSAPLLLNTKAQKCELIAKLGLDALVLEPFDRDFASLSAEAWLRQILIARLKVRGIVVGYDFTFGHRRSGNAEMLKAFCETEKLLCRIVPAQLQGDVLVSSTHIRQLLERGDMELAAELLGRPYFIDGQVVQGDGRGRHLGFPTANLSSENELIPPRGVYAAWAEHEGKRHPAAVNIGVNPSFAGTTMKIEAHLIGYEGSLYKRKLRLHFAHKLREERKFSSVAELTKQIRSDLQETLQRLKP